MATAYSPQSWSDPFVASAGASTATHRAAAMLTFP